MDKQLEVVASTISRLVPGETVSSLVRRAYEECKDDGELESVEARMLDKLHSRCVVANDRVQGVKKLQEGVSQFKAKALIPHDVLAVNRQRVREAGGLTDDLKHELGMETASERKQAEIRQAREKQPRSAQTRESNNGEEAQES